MKKIFYWIIFTVCIVVAIELLVRIGCFVYFNKYSTTFSTQAQGMWQSDSLLVWDNRPSYLFYDNSGQYNECGMRTNPGDVEMPVKQPGETWILLSGGSAMAGNGSNRNGEWLALTGVPDHAKATSIDGYLEEILNRNKDKKYRVFNSSVAGHAAWQAFEKAKKLSRAYPFDWVISMDGANEPKIIPEGKTSRFLTEELWKVHPTKTPPLSDQISWMENSALVFCLFRWKYAMNESGKAENNEKALHDKQMEYFALKGKVKYLRDENVVSSGLLSFQKTVLEEDAFFESKKIRHCHFIQPHLSLRNTNVLDSVEQSVFNYYCTVQNDTNNTLFRSVNELKFTSPTIVSLKPMHDLPYWVFVDYCHFTNKANLYIAQKIAAMVAQ